MRRRQRRWSRWLPGGVALLLVLLWLFWPRIEVFSYVSSDGVFEDGEVPQKGRTLEMVEKFFEEYRAEKRNPDLILYRRTAREWWRFWDRAYWNHRRWDYPYMPRE